MGVFQYDGLVQPLTQEVGQVPPPALIDAQTRYPARFPPRVLSAACCMVAVAPIYLPDVTTPAPPLAWRGTGPDRLDRAPLGVPRGTVTQGLTELLVAYATATYPDRFPAPPRPHGGATPALEPPPPPVVESWMGPAAPFVGRRPLHADASATRVVPLVSEDGTDLRWASESSLRPVSPRRMPEGGGVRDPFPLGTVLQEWSSTFPDRIPSAPPRPVTLDTITQDLTWDLVGVASARYPSQHTRLRRPTEGVVQPVDAPTEPAVPSVSGWHAPLPTSIPLLDRTRLSYQAWAGVSPDALVAADRGWTPVYPDRLRAIPPTPPSGGWWEPTPRGTVLLEWLTRSADRVPVAGRRIAPEGVLDPTPPAAPAPTEWRGSLPDRLSPPSRRGLGSALIDPFPLGTVQLEWIGTSRDRFPAPWRPVTLGGTVAPFPLGTVLVEWLGVGRDRLPPLLRPVTLGGTLDPFPLGTVRLEWLGIGRDRFPTPPRPVTLGGTLDPFPLGTVLLDWWNADTLPSRGRRTPWIDPFGYVRADVAAPDLVTMVGRDVLRLPRGIRRGPDLVVPVAPPAAPDLGWTGSAPDLLTRSRWSVAALLRSGAGSAGIDISATVRPGFGGQPLAGWRVMQYPGLVGSLFVEAAVAVPDVSGWALDRSTLTLRRSPHALRAPAWIGDHRELAAAPTPLVGAWGNPSPSSVPVGTWIFNYQEWAGVAPTILPPPVTWYPRTGGGRGRVADVVVTSGASARPDGPSVGDLSFTASLDHATLLQYRTRLYAVAAPTVLLSEQDIGRPPFDGNRLIRVNVAEWLALAAPGTYLVRVAAVAPSGLTESLDSNTFTVPLVYP